MESSDDAVDVQYWTGVDAANEAAAGPVEGDGEDATQ